MKPRPPENSKSQEEFMKHSIVVLCVLFAGLTATAGAQVQGQGQAQAPTQAPASGSFTIQCQPTLVGYQFSSTQTVSAYVCTTDATINGVAFNGLTFSQTNQAVSGETKAWGVIVGSLTDGSLVFFEYQAGSHTTSSVTSTATMSYKIVGGTGIANGISGSGNCSATGTNGKGNEQTCVGTFAVR
jgi:hypothetical protein